MNFRLIPVLQIVDGELFKTVNFKPHFYVGDPVNAVRVFNLKAVDEIIVLDISADASKEPNYGLIERIGTQCFMPLSYGGNISALEQIDVLFDLGVDKIILGRSAARKPELIGEIARKYGSQAIVVSVDVKRHMFSKRASVFIDAGKQRAKGYSPLEYAQMVVERGAGEIFLKSIDRDGTYMGLDHDLIKTVAENIKAPVIACGGAKDWDDMRRAITDSKASAAASGSQFTFYGKYKAVLQSYPTSSI